MANGNGCPEQWRGAVSAIGVLPVVVVLTLVLTAMRIVGTQGPWALRSLLALGAVVMMALPWLLLRRLGRRRLGLVLPTHRGPWLRAGLVSGFFFALIVGLLGLAIYGHGAGNGYVSIARYYDALMDARDWPAWRLHLVFTLPALFFSPIGEELFFRGVLQLALEQRVGTNWATRFECGLFALVHLCHHGFVRGTAELAVPWVSALAWVLMMYLTARLFAWLRHRSGSLYPAMLAHAGFNLAMNLVIFAWLWPVV